MNSYGKRPEDLECKALWELYVLLENLDRPYLKARENYKSKEYLYYIQSVTRPEGKAYYGFDSFGDIGEIRIPDGRDEWIDIVLLRKEGSKRIEYKVTVKTNTEYDSDFSVFTLMTLARISIPDMSEIENAEMDCRRPYNGLPVT